MKLRMILNILAGKPVCYNVDFTGPVQLKKPMNVIFYKNRIHKKDSIVMLWN